MAYDVIREKVAQAAALLNEYDIDCWITFVRETALNGDPVLPFLVASDLTWQSALIFGRDGSRTAIVGKYDKQMVVDTGAYDRVLDYVEGIRAPLLSELRRLAPRSVALNYSTDSEICDGLTHGMYLSMMTILQEAGLAERVTSAQQIISALRQRKSPTELAHLKEAICHAEEIFDAVRTFVRPGKTEADIAGFMREQVARRHLGLAWDPGTCPAVFTGPDTAAAHYGPTGRVVQSGHVLNMDFGVRVEGYVSDLQRSFYVLRPGETDAPPEVQRGFAVIRTAIEKARAIMKPGVQGVAVDAAARTAVTAAGYAEFPHGVGHQVGRFAHDGTALLGPPWEKYGSKPFAPLEAGMVFTLEPRLTVDGCGVVTVEEMLVVTDDGAEYLSRPQRALWLVGGAE
ncbi:MAG: aminopeptidase P family protein [Bacteroidetes bacterium]|nr:aminopeptidase P family protein [Bacteroidota bacterium]